MTKYKMILGDWSRDGDGVTQTIYVDIPDIFGPDLLRSNFEENVKKFGFDPVEVVARDYEEPTIPLDLAKRLFDAGYDNQEDEDSDSYLHDDYSQPPVGMLWVDGYDAYLSILMFFFGHGLEGWEYEIASDETPLLLGGHHAILGNRSAGYGLFEY